MKAALKRIIPAMALAGIVAGGVAWLAGMRNPVGLAWGVTTGIALLMLVGRVMSDCGAAVWALTSAPFWPWRVRLRWANISPAR